MLRIIQVQRRASTTKTMFSGVRRKTNAAGMAARQALAVQTTLVICLAAERRVNAVVMHAWTPTANVA
jgi:hypothetical protein